MVEWTAEEIMDQVQNGESVTVYVYTPMCGTCQLAKKMLTVVEAVLPDLQIGMLNLNYAPQFAVQYKIESVPCLLTWERGEVKKQIYAFHSVEHVYNELK